MKNQLTELLGIRYPIVQSGMMWVGRAELAFAVSNAGGLGINRADPAHRGRSAPGNRALPHHDPRSSSAASRQRASRYCTSAPVRHVLSAERNGVDVISINGFECAGHPGEDDIPELILIPAAVKALKIPVIASGGIADGRGMAATLALGAQGVDMGTRFMTTKEAPIHDTIKQALVATSERDTTLIFRTLKNTARVFSNPVAMEVVNMERRPGGCSFDVKHLVAGGRGRQGLETGDINSGLIWASMAIGLINDIPACAELLERMMVECRDEIEKALAMYQ